MTWRTAAATALALVALPWLHPVTGYSCPNFCSHRGLCQAQGLCACPAGWTGADCSVPRCPLGAAWADVVTATDVGHQPVECSNRGTCDPESGLCHCELGFTGAACERMTCSCNGHGRCESLRQYARTQDPGQGAVYEYAANWDADKIYGCVCDAGYWGPTCLLRECPRGDDPLTGTLDDPAGLQRNEKQRVSCRATGGFFTLAFRGHTTDAIEAGDSMTTVRAKLEALPSIRAVTVTFGGITLVACTAIGNDISIEFTQDFGDLPDLVLDGTQLVHSTPSTTPSLVLATVTQGSRESLPCSRRGFCDRDTGICACYPKYFSSDGRGGVGARGDCGAVVATVTSCPGEIACSGQGTCRGPPTYDCVCHDGYSGGDCSERVCPRASAWFDRPIATDVAHQPIECAGAGTCDRAKGECICAAGFTGAACHRMTCPNDCSGHGTCLTMEMLARAARVQGELVALKYGAVPNRKETWDFDMARGCLCEPGWQGHACQHRECPTGDDPLTRVTPSGQRQQNEVQELVCVGAATATTTSSLALRFRDAETPQLPATATATQLEDALAALTTVHGVRVTLLDTTGGGQTAFCTATGATLVRVEFTADFGDLPPLRWVVDGALSVTLRADGNGGSVRGSKEEAVCAQRGLCDLATGQCRCVYGFTSSDGKGQPGERGDCGYMEPIYLNAAGLIVDEALAG